MMIVCPRCESCALPPSRCICYSGSASVERCGCCYCKDKRAGLVARCRANAIEAQQASANLSRAARENVERGVDPTNYWRIDSVKRLQRQALQYHNAQRKSMEAMSK